MNTEKNTENTHKNPSPFFDAMRQRRDGQEPLFIVPDKYETGSYVPQRVWDIHSKCGHPLDGEFHYIKDDDMIRAQTSVGYGLKTSMKKCPYCTEENERLRRIRLSAKNLDTLLPDADIPSYARNWTFENFPNSLDAFAIETLTGVTEESLVLMRQGQTGISVFIHGKPGCGKTSAASSALQRYMQEGHRCLFVSVRRYIRLLQEKIDKKNGDKELTSLESLVLSVPVLVFDDLGSEYPSNWVLGKVFDIVEERGASGFVTIITSNNSIATLRKFWLKSHDQDDEIQHQSGRIIRRLSQRFHCVPMDNGQEENTY